MATKQDSTTFTQRTLMALVTEMAERKESDARVQTLIETLARENGVPLPAR